MQGSQQNSYIQGELPPSTQQFVTRTVEYRNGNMTNSQTSPNRVSGAISVPPPPPHPQYYAPIQQVTQQPIQQSTQQKSYSSTYVNPDQNRATSSTTYVYTSTTTNQNNVIDTQVQRQSEGQPRSNMEITLEKIDEQLQMSRKMFPS